jgi:RNA polymerase sigma-70 factor (ECF subfamily)
VYQALWPVLRTFVGRQLPMPESEDAAQEALLKVFARASDFDPERDAVTWALGIAAFEVRTARKRRLRRRENLVALAPPNKDAPSTEQAVIDRDLEAALLEILGALRPSDVETIQAVLSGRSPPIPRATFRKRLERALNRLRLAWRARHGLD